MLSIIKGVYFFYCHFVIMMVKIIFISSTDRGNGGSFYFIFISTSSHGLYYPCWKKSAICLEGHSDVRLYSLELESLTSHTKSFSWYGRNIVKLEIYSLFYNKKQYKHLIYLF